jgi:WD40 repeat protein
MPWGRQRRVATWAVLAATLISVLASVGFASDGLGAILERQVGVGQLLKGVFSPDGAMLLTANSDGTLRLWDVATGRAVRRIAIEGWRAGAVAFSADGDYIQCVEDANVLTTLELATGRVVDRVETGLQAPGRAYLSPDGRIAVLAPQDQLPEMWDTSTKTPLFVLGKPPHDWLYDARFSADAQLVLVSTARTGLQVWDMNAGGPVRRLHGADVVSVRGFDISPDGGIVAQMVKLAPTSSNGNRTELRVWNLGSDTEPTVHRYSRSYTVELLRFLPDGRTLLVMSSNQGGMLIDSASGQVLRTFSGLTENWASVEISPQGLVPLFDWNYNLHLYRPGDGETLQVLRGYMSHFNRFAVSLDGTKVAVVPNAAIFPQVWSIPGEGPPINIGDLNGGISNQVCLSEDGSVALVRAWHPTLHCTETGAWIQGYDGFSANPAYAAALASDASFAVFSRQDGSIELWPTGEDGPARVHRDYAGRKYRIALSADDRHLATGAVDGAVSVWDLHTGQHVQQFRDLGREVVAVAISPDGTQVVACDNSSRLLLWDVRSGSVLAWHRKAATAVAFDLAGERLAIADGNAIQILDARNGAPMRRIGANSGVNRAHTWQVELLQFSPDGKRLYSASPFDGVKQWLLDPTAPRPGQGACHSADADCDGRIDLAELMRLTQFYVSRGYHCADPVWGSEDTYHPGVGARLDCAPHDGDYNPGDWNISLPEVLRAVQLYRFGGYVTCADGEDGFCPVTASVF